MSELSFDDYLDRITIQDVLTHAGYKLNRRDGLRYPCYVMTDNEGKRIRGDKFIVMPSSKTCFHPPIVKSYNIISLINEFPEKFSESSLGLKGKALIDAVCHAILNEPLEHRSANILEPHRDVKPFDIKEYQIFQFQKYNYDTIRKFYPYFKTRGIDTRTQQAFSDHLMLATKESSSKQGTFYTNLAFPITVPGKHGIVGFEERGRARLDGSSGYKGKALGSNSSEGLWIASPNNTALSKAKDVFWFESAFDAMAYYQIHERGNSSLNDVVYLSTGGSPTIMQFRGVIKEASEATHHLCFDNDIAGRQFVISFNNELRKMKENLPKIGSDMQEYMSSLSKPTDVLSGNPTFLPEELRLAYEKFYDEREELWSMKECGLDFDGDILDQREKISHLQENLRQRINDKLCIGREHGPLVDLGTYDIPGWALMEIEYGQQEDLSDQERILVKEFIEEKFPEGFLCEIDWDKHNDLNRNPAFGTIDPHAFSGRGESPYQAVETYQVHFFHPSRREGEPFPNLTVIAEIPKDGCKDWNEQLLNMQKEELCKRLESEETVGDKRIASGLDLDADGQVEIGESEEKKQYAKYSR